MQPLFESLATKNDRMWPHQQWPPMRFRQGLKVGNQGGHGFIRYLIDDLQPNALISFRFTAPRGFAGGHRLKIQSFAESKTALEHTIEMDVRGIALLKWYLLVRPLHNALIEDAFDKIENQFSSGQARTPWSLWVRILRFLLK